MADQRIRRTVVTKLGLCFAFEFGDDVQRQYLAELDAPLVERVDVPYRALSEDAVLVEGHELAERCGRQPRQQKRVGRPVPHEGAMGHEPIRRSLAADLLSRLAKGERFTLGEDVRQQHVMLLPQGIEWLTEGDEIAGDQPGSLMNELIEGVLAIGAGLTPIDGAGVMCD